MTPTAFLDAAERRLADAGYTIDRRGIDTPILTAHRSRFTWWARTATTRTIFVVSATDRVTAEGWAWFRREAIELASRMRGWWQNVCVVPVLAGGTVATDAAAAAESARPRAHWFLGTEQPALVDLSTGRVHRYDGLFVLGALYGPHMRKQLSLVTDLVNAA